MLTIVHKKKNKIKIRFLEIQTNNDSMVVGDTNRKKTHVAMAKTNIESKIKAAAAERAASQMADKQEANRLVRESALNFTN